MVVFAIEGVLALLVITGSIMIVWGVRRFQLSTKVMAVTFAITAASWFALIITTISITVRTFVLSST